MKLSAMRFGENLFGGNAPLKLPAMLVKSQTPNRRRIWREQKPAPRFKLADTAEFDGMIAKGMSGRRPTTRLAAASA